MSFLHPKLILMITLQNKASSTLHTDVLHTVPSGFHWKGSSLLPWASAGTLKAGLQPLKPPSQGCWPNFLTGTDWAGHLPNWAQGIYLYVPSAALYPSHKFENIISTSGPDLRSNYGHRYNALRTQSCVSYVLCPLQLPSSWPKVAWVPCCCLVQRPG